MIDMHLHTYYSDGTMSPEDLIKRAAERGVRTLAITDHDGFNGITEALEAGERYGVEVIPGVEFSAIMAGEELDSPPPHYIGDIISIHILGYQIDINNKELKEAVDDMREKRRERNHKLLSALNKIGYRIGEEDLLQRKGQDFIGKPNFALALVKKGYVKSPREASTPGLYLRHPEAREIHREKIHVRKVISLINGAGGYAVLAHPMKVRFPDKDEAHVYERLELLLDRLRAFGLAGMECYYSSHTADQAARLVEMAKARGLMITSGSDFHGPDFDPGIDIGVTIKKEE